MKKTAIIVVLWAISVLVICGSAEDSNAGSVFTFGSNNDFSQIVVPNNSYVHQGENISQGNYYDLSGVYGFSGILCWWKNDDDTGYTYPDKTFNLNNMKLYHVYIDPSTWPVGRYYPFDGGEYGFRSSTSGKGNGLVFYVVSSEPAAKKTQEPVAVVTVVKNDEITVNIGGNVTEIPVTYTVEEIVITPEPTDTPTNQHTIIIPTTVQETPIQPNSVDQYGHRIQEVPVGDVQKVTPAPVPLWLPITGCIGAAFVILRKKYRL